MSSGRLNLRLEPGADPKVRYRAELSIESQSWQGSVEVDAEGAVRFEVPGQPPAWLCQATSAILRAEWRNRRGADATPWPRRITRWRLAPEC